MSINFTGNPRPVILLGASVAIATAFIAGRWVGAQVPSAPPAFKAEEPPYRGLDANLYMRTAAEYRACCLQAFNIATERLTDEVEKLSGRRAAVILDLDETVLDNSGFQAAQTRSNLAYDQRLWDLWEASDGDRVALIPGAKEFIDTVERLGVTPIYISNRNARYFEETKRVLARLQLPLKDESCLKLADARTGSDKTSRRAEVEMKFSVVLLIGDNLRDFDETFRCDGDLVKTGKFDDVIDARFREVEKRREDLGRRFIILPNPAYGEWNRVLGHGFADLDRLAPVMPR